MPGKLVLQPDAVPIRHRNPGVRHRLAEVTDHALRDRPEIRYKTAAEFKRALEAAV